MSNYKIYYRVWEGNSLGEQKKAFATAFSRVESFMLRMNHPVEIEYLGLKEMREQSLHIKDIVTWLISSHVHFVITHIHQGMECQGSSIEELYDEVSRLYFHAGFPSGIQLGCPIFTQDKWKYLQHIPATMRTCKIDLETSDTSVWR
jgi:hypothetical protein